MCVKDRGSLRENYKDGIKNNIMMNPNASIFIVGCGPVGLLAIGIAKVMGATKV